MTASQTTVKTCRQCAHSQDISVLYCREVIDPVEGLPVPCSDARKSDTCGPDGKLFEQRETITEIVNRAPIINTSSAGETPKPSLGQMYEEDDPGIRERIQSKWLPPKG